MSSLNHYFFWASFVIVVVISVTALFCVFPAYWRTHNRAFLYLAFAFMLAIFDTVSDHSIGLWRVPREQVIAYVILRRFVSLIGFALLAFGVVSLTRSFLAGTPPKDDITPSA